MHKLLKKPGIFSGILAVFAASLLFAPVTLAAEPRDCDDNAIIKCGALTQSELKQDYDANTTGDIKAVFSHYGITETDMAAISSAKMGRVHKDGRIVVDGETVATGAKTVGRHNMSGSAAVTIGGNTFYERSPSVSFNSDSLSAIVIMKNGVFHRAIITSCGNPVVATPTPKPEPPKPAPAYSCESLTARKISRNEYQFTTDASASNGAAISRYVVDFGDGSTSDTSNKTITHTYAEAKDYTIKATVYAKVGNQEVVVSDAKGHCVVKINVAVEPCPYDATLPKDSSKCYEPCPYDKQLPKNSSKCYEPCPYNKDLPKDSKDCVQPVVKAAEIPKTGPEQVILAGVGVSSLTAAGYFFQNSRRQLISKLLNRK